MSLFLSILLVDDTSNCLVQFTFEFDKLIRLALCKFCKYQTRSLLARMKF